MLRKPISRRSYVALGVASFVTLGALYSVLTYMVHRDYPDNKTIPTWGQIYRDGIQKGFLPRTEAA